MNRAAPASVSRGMAHVGGPVSLGRVVSGGHCRARSPGAQAADRLPIGPWT